MTKPFNNPAEISALPEGAKVHIPRNPKHLYIKDKDGWFYVPTLGIECQTSPYLRPHEFISYEEPKPEPRVATTLEEALSFEKLRVEIPDNILGYLAKSPKCQFERSVFWSLDDFNAICAAMHLGWPVVEVLD